jgi:hypothetical protein
MTAEVRARMDVPDAVKITDADILNAFNDAYKDIAVKTLCIERTETLTTTKGSPLIATSGIKVTQVVY